MTSTLIALIAAMTQLVSLLQMQIALQTPSEIGVVLGAKLGKATSSILNTTTIPNPPTQTDIDLSQMAKNFDSCKRKVKVTDFKTQLAVTSNDKSVLLDKYINLYDSCKNL